MKWDEMRGDERERFCDKCNRTVVNLSVLSEAQRVALLAAAQPGQLCAAYYERLSGKAGEPARKPGLATPGNLLRLGAVAAYIAAMAAVANHAAHSNSAASTPRESIADAFDSVRYKVEDWIDDVRVFLGGEPRRTMTLGVVCVPSSRPAPPPPPAPASTPPAGGSKG